MKILRRLVIVFTILLSITSCKNDNQKENALFPVCLGESPHSSIVACESDESCKWGYINKDGEVVIDFQFDWADCFSEGLARVRIGNRNTGKWGFVDKTGKIVIAPQFDEVSSFSEGLAMIRIGDGGNRKYGFINKKGEYVIEPIYRYASSFSEGLAMVCDGNAYGFIDKNGNIVIDIQFGAAYDFSEGLAAVMTQDNVWGYIDHNGDFVIMPQIQYTKGFSEGLAAVIKDNKIGFVDKSGNMIIEVCDYENGRHFGMNAEFEYIHNVFPSCWGYQIYNYMKFVEGVACVRRPCDEFMNRSYTTYIDENGELVGLPCSDGQNFSEGLAAIKEGTGDNNGKKYGYINEKGKLVINYQFEDAEDFNNGRARVLIGGKMAYINQQGAIIWKE